MTTTTITIDTVTMTLEAARSAEWAGVNVAEDVRRLRAGEISAEALLAECLDGAESEHEGDWRDYVDAVCAAAGVADEDDEGEDDCAVRARAEADVRSLAKQDAEYFTEFATDSPAEAIARWRQSGREAGDVELVEAIDLLGTDAEAIYARARGRA